MKKLMICAFILSSTISSFASEYSLGVVLGNPTGLSGKYKLSEKNQLNTDLSAGYSTLDYMWKDKRNFDVQGLNWLYGAGAVIKKGIGARVLTGVEYDIKQYPFHLMANISFAIINSDDFKTHLGMALGARYDF